MKFLSYLYFLITSFRNFLYDKKILKIKRIEDLFVICIGNITVGGTGKTPTVQYFAKKLSDEGRKVAVISRGYRGKRKVDPMVVSDSKNILVTARESGDESYMHAMNLKVPVIVGRDRYEAAKLAKEKFGVDTVILDDGFQHRKFYRDWNIVLVDATNPFGWNNLLPKGTLREDFDKATKRVSEFIITKSDLIPERDLKNLKKLLKEKYKKPVSVARHGIKSLYNIEGDLKPLFWIKGKRVLLFSGLANPLNFEKTVISLNPEYIERMDFLDHHSFKKSDIEAIKKRAEEMKAAYIITTEKDIVKISKNIGIENLYILKIELDIIEDQTLVCFKEEESEHSK